MCQWTLSWIVSTLAWMALLFGVSDSDVYTSSKKIEDMVLLEEQILNNLQTAVTDLRNETASSLFSTFYRNRLSKVKERRIDADLLGLLKHPNGIYHHIKQFATEYQNIRSVLGNTTSASVQKYLSLIADQADIAGARLSILRLQKVYGLKAPDIVRGDYLGYIGPHLNDIDALEIGQAAFSSGRLHDAIAWLEEALEIIRRHELSDGSGYSERTTSLTGRILALLGRIYVRLGNQDTATAMYRKAQISNPTDGDVTTLERELETKPRFTPTQTYETNFIRLCTLQNKLTQGKFDRRINCSYRDVILPYYRFKQELVSISPYVTLFYDVISDYEGKTIINLTKEKLQRGRVIVNGSAVAKESRTSDTSWLSDGDVPYIARLSKRIAAITNLDTSPHKPGSAYSSEAFQIVNYGMGGHYDPHSDTFSEPLLFRDKGEDKITYGGNRLATFLIYLSEVERGGSTVFPTVDIAVSPVKNMALFWYSFTPSGKLDTDTLHAGCPVVIGHKWVTNKWMWLYGNTFTRRCGLSENATQLDIDQYMRRGWF